MKVSKIQNHYTQNFGLTIIPEVREKLISQVDKVKTDEFRWSAPKLLEVIENSGPNAIKVLDADLTPFRTIDGRKACHFTTALSYTIDNTEYILKTGTRFFPQIPDIDFCCQGGASHLISNIVDIFANHGKLLQNLGKLRNDLPEYSGIWNNPHVQKCNDTIVKIAGVGKPNQTKTTEVLKW